MPTKITVHVEMCGLLTAVAGSSYSQSLYYHAGEGTLGNVANLLVKFEGRSTCMHWFWAEKEWIRANKQTFVWTTLLLGLMIIVPPRSYNLFGLSWKMFVIVLKLAAWTLWSVLKIIKWCTIDFVLDNLWLMIWIVGLWIRGAVWMVSVIAVLWC
jgi:hypothetical protein